METLPESYVDTPAEAGLSLSYDDTVPYSELPPPPASGDAGQSSLAERIGRTKVYLISDSLAKAGKVREQTYLLAR